MIEHIYSNVEKSKLLHQIVRLPEIGGRVNLCENDSYIQCATLVLDKGTTFRPHKHNIQERYDAEYIPQESWIVIRGSVRCILYDLDDSIIATPILNMGDASFTFFGGHNYEILEDNTIVYEYKTGKYIDQKKYKTFI